MHEEHDTEKKKSLAGELSLDDLKAFILSIEWEINDEVMTQFIDEVESLKSSYHGDNVVTIFLKLLSIIGKYIRAKKVASHPDSIKLLNSVYQNLDRIVSASDLDDNEKKRLLMLEAAKFKELKEKVALSKNAALVGRQPAGAVSRGKPQQTTTSVRPESTPDVPPVSPAMVELIRKEVRSAIKTEFQQLKEEIRSMINSSR